MIKFHDDYEGPALMQGPFVGENEVLIRYIIKNAR